MRTVIPRVVKDDIIVKATPQALWEAISQELNEIQTDMGITGPRANTVWGRAHPGFLCANDINSLIAAANAIIDSEGGVRIRLNFSVNDVIYARDINDIFNAIRDLGD